MRGERESIRLIHLVSLTAVILALVIFFGLRSRYGGKQLNLTGHDVS